MTGNSEKAVVFREANHVSYFSNAMKSIMRKWSTPRKKSSLTSGHHQKPLGSDQGYNVTKTPRVDDDLVQFRSNQRLLVTFYTDKKLPFIFNHTLLKRTYQFPSQGKTKSQEFLQATY